MKIRTRFAPSPTGFMHIGGLRTALYAWLFARKNDGTFILRIEDTDQNREVEGAVEKIYASLRLAGLDWDEGPDVGGNYGPYIQSERKDMYLPYAKELVKKGEAYYCFCSKERLDDLRKEAENRGETFKYDKHCLHLSKDEVNAKLAAGEEYVIRQNVQESGVSGFDDVLFGHIEVENSTLDDAVLIKSDGLPTYNFANVIDDHTMGISHVLRGSEYLSSTPRYNLLYKAFGWDIPVYVHMSLIMANAQRKLSKRYGDPSFEDLIAQGYIKDAIINYVALLGWSPGDDREIFSLDELAEAFSLEGLSKSPAIFGIDKLRWFNGEYIKKMPLGEFHKILLPYIEKAIDINRFDTMYIAELLQSRCESLAEMPEMIDFLESMPDYELSLYEHKKMKTDATTALPVLKDLAGVLKNIDDWNFESVKQAVTNYIEENGLKNGFVLWPLRVAISGKMSTPGGAYEIAHLLGREETLRRLEKSIGMLS